MSTDVQGTNVVAPQPGEVRHMEIDFLVMGAGMAGMTAAAAAAQAGAAVAVVEKAKGIGGSAVLSAGGIARPTNLDEFVSVNPSGDPALAALLVNRYDETIAWIESLGTGVTTPGDTSEVLGFASTVRGIDVVSYIDRCRAVIEQAGGWIVCEGQILSLISDDHAVVGAVVQDRDGQTEIRSRWVLLASGGFQNDAELRRTYLGQAGEAMLVRSNPISSGDGLRLGLSAGAATTQHMDRFYGHTVPAPLDHTFGPRDYVRLAQFFLSTHCIVLDRHGDRFTDESGGYYTNSKAVLDQPGSRGLLVGDQQIRDEDSEGGTPSRTLGYERLDRITEAKRSGAHVVEAQTVKELEALLEPLQWSNAAKGVSIFNRGLSNGNRLDPPRKRNRRPITEPPFFAMEIQPAITFTFGGLRIDDSTHVLRPDGSAIGGLLAAGGDAGGYYYERYSGGLGMACVMGLTAASTVLASLHH
jgi:succinate dehydrogenase/fumarate reductase flavoprotein subunit